MSLTWFNRFPTEIIYEIFDYLSSNDILYTFFYYNKRLNNLILHDQHHINYFELPSSNTKFWQTILFTIESKVQTLIISTLPSCISLNNFSNLTSIIVNSSFALTFAQFESILNNKQFHKLISFKILNQHSINTNFLLTKIFNKQNSLKIFQCMSTMNFYYRNNPIGLQSNIHLNSLILNLNNLKYIYNYIQYTPNLKYLNIQLKEFFYPDKQYNFYKFKLQKLSIIIKDRYQDEITENDLIELIDFIKTFSLSLKFLSLNFTDSIVSPVNNILWNGDKLKKDLLETMKELKYFHLNVKLSIDGSYEILSTFQNQFWFDHQWCFEINRFYLYSLPYQFDEYYEYDHMKFSNKIILENKLYLWSNVKIIHFERFDKIDLIGFIKTQMPNLQIIKINKSSRDNFNLMIENSTKCSQDKRIDHDINTVTTLDINCGKMENEIEHLINILPNLKYLILNDSHLPSMTSDLVPILNKKIERLDITCSYILENLFTNINMYFSSVKYVQFTFDFTLNTFSRSEIILNCLTNLPNLISLTIYPLTPKYHSHDYESIFKPILAKLDKKYIQNNYELKYLDDSLSFLKKNSSNNDNNQSTTSSFSLPLFILLCFIFIIILYNLILPQRLLDKAIDKLFN
ncbi:unnamed protein product [Adineta steineri]|uniref:F-box domain-containing protein n=1 Tax=Adineta steineri TaxID=433720 RepID=A0A819BVQ7_9BILA|nr:unnamed protein product [Adineta steineri]CAF3803001.1 unnamed protein product [Adineta steineri]